MPRFLEESGGGDFFHKTLNIDNLFPRRLEAQNVVVSVAASKAGDLDLVSVVTQNGVAVIASSLTGMYAVEPPKEAASIHELTAMSVHQSAPEILSDHESPPMPSEVVAPAAEPPKGAASSHELSARHVMAKEANHELSALLWMLSAPVCSACPAMAACSVCTACPAMAAYSARPTIAPCSTCSAMVPGSSESNMCLPQLHGPGPPVFHCLPLLHGPGPPVLHCLSLLHNPGPPLLHRPGPPSNPLFCLCSPTLLDCFECQESLLEGGI
ncbi:hypothetical protein M9458_008793, partial [Cirrhinus mrigala]